MGIVVIGDVFIDVKGYSISTFYSRRKKCGRRSSRSTAEWEEMW